MADKARPEDLYVRRYLTAVNRVEDVVLVLKGCELIVLAETLALGVHVTHCFAVVTRVRRRKRELLVGGSKVFTSGRIESFDFDKRSLEVVITEENKLLARFLVRESRLRRGQRRCTGAAEDRRRWRCHNYLADLRSSYGRMWYIQLVVHVQESAESSHQPGRGPALM